MPEDRESARPPDGLIPGPRADERISALAGEQHGVVSRGQLLDARVSETMIERRIASGQLTRLHRGVYAVGHAHLRIEGFWIAAVLAVGPGAVLSHRDAAALHGLRPVNRSRVEVSTPYERKPTSKLDVYRRRSLDARDVMTVNGIPVTTVSRTLVDLAEVLAHQELVNVCSEAERQHKLDAKAIEEAIGRLRGRRGSGIAQIRAALADLAAHGATLTRSPLEDRLLPLLDAHSIPRPRLNLHTEGYEGDAVWQLSRAA